MNKWFIIFVCFTGCDEAYPDPEIQDRPAPPDLSKEVTTTDQEPTCKLMSSELANDRGEVEKMIIGRARIGNCLPEPLRIDPAWNEQEQKALSLAVDEWKKAIGIDLGDLPISDECKWNPYIEMPKNCITKADRLYSNDFSSDTIRIYNDAMCDVYGSEYLEALTAVAIHEMGHWIGMDHLATKDGIMFERLAYFNITQSDIDFYEESCLEN